MRHGLVLPTILLAASVGSALAQEAKKPMAIAPSARLAAAKTAYVRHGGGNEIPYNAVLSGMEGWARYTLVDSPEKADIIVEVTSPGETNGVSISGRTETAGGKESSASTKQLSGTDVRLVVYDARSKMPLWSASEPAKSAFRQKAREDNLLHAGQRLIAKFRDRVEPLPQ